MREQVDKKTDVGLAAAGLMAEGKMVPSSMILDMLQAKIKENKNASGFLIDGFPRAMDQATEFETKIGPCRAVLAFQCSMETLEQRLLERGKTSGRADDNLETIKKRFATFKEQSEPVIEYYRKRGKCTEISSEKSIEEVYNEARELFVSPVPINHRNMIFVLGGPGSGKGTQCANIIKEFGFKHISTGDLLRKEVDQQTPIGLQVSQYMANGSMAPMVSK